jgi:hypothetical protein
MTARLANDRAPQLVELRSEIVPPLGHRAPVVRAIPR